MTEALSDIEALARRASFLSLAARTQLIELWLQHLLGEDAWGHYRSSPLHGALPGPWRAAVERAFELLTPWRPLTLGRPAAAHHVVSALVERLHQADWVLRKAPESPRHSPLAARMQQAAGLPVEAFTSQSQELLDLLVREMAGGGLHFGALRELWAERQAERQAPAQGAQSSSEVRARQATEDAALREAILGRWSALYAEEVDEWERRTLLAALERLHTELERKRSALQRLTRLLGLGLEYLARGADWTSGFWREDLWKVLEDFAERVERSPSVQRLAEMLGRYEEDRRRYEAQLTEEEVPERRSRMLAGGRSEVKGLHLSDELDRLTAGELALLADPDTELLFYARYMEKRLLTYEMDAHELYEAHRRESRMRLRPRPDRQRGPIVLCLDTSGSMAGEPEVVAKTLCLAVLRVALRERRTCWAISFSSANDLRELELSRFPESLSELLTFLAGGFHGGTDPAPALDAAMRRIENTDFSRADLLLVTDGIFELGEDIVSRVQAVRTRMNFRFHALIVGDHSSTRSLELADVQWAWRPGAQFLEGGVQLVRGVETA